MEDETRQIAIRSLVLYLRKMGFTTVKADGAEEGAPFEIKIEGTQKGFTPDITAKKFTSSYIYEIENCNKLNIEAAVEKWKLFSDSAIKTKGRLYLVIPENKSKYINDILQEHEIDAGVLKMKNL